MDTMTLLNFTHFGGFSFIFSDTLAIFISE